MADQEIEVLEEQERQSTPPKLIDLKHESLKKTKPVMQRPQKTGGCVRNGIPLLCMVCTDRASGYHYGVPSCEGCKAFFKRSLQVKQFNYKCPANNNCTIDKMSRKCCQACRLEKCHAVGMSKEYLGNKIKRSKSDKFLNKPKKYLKSDVASDCIESVLTPMEIEQEAMIEKLSNAHKKIYLAKESEYNSNDLQKTLCHVIGQQLVSIIDWAKTVPGYSSLVISDQAILLQSTWLDLLVMNWFYLTIKSNDDVTISTNLTLKKEEAVELGFLHIFDQLKTLSIVVKKHNIDEEEVACLKAISLTNPDSYKLADFDKVRELRSGFTSSLQYYSNNRHRDTPFKYAKLLLLLAQLKHIVYDVVKWLRAVKSTDDASKLSDLVVEMMEANIAS